MLSLSCQRILQIAYSGGRRKGWSVMEGRYLFVVNPSSGAGKGEIIAKLLGKLLPEHPQFGREKAEVVLTDRVDPSTLSEKLSWADVGIAIGGDGTVSRLVPLCLECERPPALGMIPLGTSNDLARALGVSVTKAYTNENTLQGTLNDFLRAEEEKLDIFSVNDKLLFCNYFSVGFDAAIVRDFDTFRGSKRAKMLPPGRLKNNILYFLTGLANARFHLPPPIEIECAKDAESNRLILNSPCLAIIVSNLPIYAGGCRIAPEAVKDDGVFEMTIAHNLYQFIRMILTRFFPFLGLPHGLGRYQCRRATIRLASPGPSQIDGEQCSEADTATPCMTIAHHAQLRVLPAGPSTQA
jgi:diacylglycerol kinase family enzyme